MSENDQDRGTFSQGRWVPPVYRMPEMSDGELELLRKRQRDRARILALLLGAFVILMFFITIAKTSTNW